MAKQISFVKSYFVALWIQTLIYGSYIVLFFGCMCVLFFRRAVATPKIISTFIPALFLLSTAHVIINLFKGVKAFTVVDNPNIIFADFEAPIDLAKEAVYTTTAVLADTLLIYRCYIVWGHKRNIVVPVLLLLLRTGVRCMSVNQYTALENRDGASAQYADDLKKWFMVLYSAMLVNNILTTTLIDEIWWCSRQSVPELGWKYQAEYNWIVVVDIESGAIYSFSLLFYLILYTIELQAQVCLFQSPMGVFPHKRLQKLIFDSLCQIASIMPTLIIVRIGLGMGRTIL
ncbi:hypothetical protein BDV98DRAFT_659305 [Pterulicium gracile]|uniref:Fungal pheromone STE3G-protein-coupled receptor n=1 Tax=Pterulicium gracile TaxID=1884261 RepID=A0A5C3Q7I0_9AGAR|nr:hypothetical protein BDV98DRAFT_659305 [Pterula gracilis]